MVLSKTQHRTFAIYREFRDRPMTVSALIRANRSYLLALLCFPAILAVSYYTLGESGLLYAGAVEATILLRDYRYLKSRVQVWPAVREVIEWDALSKMLDGVATDGTSFATVPAGSDVSVEPSTRRLVSTALVSVVSGIGFAAGLAIIGVVSFWLCLPRGLFSTREDFVRFPPGLTIVEHERVAGQPHLTVRGTVQNAGPSEWTSVMVEASIKCGVAQVNKCDTEIRGKFRAGERRAFEIICDEAASDNTPENLGYEVQVTEATAG